MHLIWDWVVAEFSGEWLAAGESPDAEPGAARYAEALDGFVGVAGTCGMEAAGAGEENRQIRFVKAQGKERGFYRIAMPHIVLSRAV